MKIAFSVASILVACGVAAMAAPDSAYQALHVVGSERGRETLKHVIEVDGRAGVPQPSVWRIVLDDPAAAGGTRELDVSGGKIVGEHTPIRSYAGAATPIDFSKLNLDSSGAFTVVEKAAQKSKIGFDSVDYALRPGLTGDGAPQWVIHIMDGTGHSIGHMTLAASNGEIVSNDLGRTHSLDAGTTAPQPPPPDYTVQETDHDNVYAGGSPAATPQRQEDDSDTEDTHGLRVGHRIKGAILSAGQSLKNFVTGNSGD